MPLVWVAARLPDEGTAAGARCCLCFGFLGAEFRIKPGGHSDQRPTYSYPMLYCTRSSPAGPRRMLTLAVPHACYIHRHGTISLLGRVTSRECGRRRHLPARQRPFPHGPVTHRSLSTSALNIIPALRGRGTATSAAHVRLVAPLGTPPATARNESESEMIHIETAQRPRSGDGQQNDDEMPRSGSNWILLN